MKPEPHAGAAARQKLTGLLGMCRRAGRLTMGFDASAGLVSAGKARLVLTASDLSPKSQKELDFLLNRKGETPVFWGRLEITKEELGTALGTGKPVGVLAVSDAGFARAIRPLCMPCHELHDLEEENRL